MEARKDSCMVKTWPQQSQRWAGCLISARSQPVNMKEQYSRIIWCMVMRVRALGELTLLLVQGQEHGMPILSRAEIQSFNIAHNEQ